MELLKKKKLVEMIRKNEDIPIEEIRKDIRGISRVIYAKFWDELVSVFSDIRYLRGLLRNLNKEFKRLESELPDEAIDSWIARQSQRILDEIYEYVWGDSK